MIIFKLFSGGITKSLVEFIILMNEVKHNFKSIILTEQGFMIKGKSDFRKRNTSYNYRTTRKNGRTI